LSVPDPNIFGGSVRVRRAGADEWSEVPLTPSAQVGRGIGVADLAYAITSGREQRASGDLAFHVLDIMTSFEMASDSGRHVDVASGCARPAPLPLGLHAGMLEP